MTDAGLQMVDDAERRSLFEAYLLCLLFGLFGAHRFYLGRTGTGALILTMTLVSLPLMFAFIGLVTIWIPAIWCLVDLFLIPGMTREHNQHAIRTMSR